MMSGDKEAAACVVGVDVGGTNTDAVILSGREVISSSKQTTTSDVTTGVLRAVHGAIQACSANIYSTTPTFARTAGQLQGSNELARVAVLRLATPPCTTAVMPFGDFPQRLRSIVDGGATILDGGCQFDGSEIAPISPKQLIEAVRKYLDSGISHFVVCAVFSPVSDRHELQAEALLRKEFGDSISVTLSHQLGQLGLLERENAAILNESLKPVAAKTLSGVENGLRSIGISAPLFLSQNDGTVCSLAEALRRPVLTFASGPTNSMRGAAHISGALNAVVVDVGGTSTDVGVIVNGFPRETNSKWLIGGVPTNFRMPDTVSIGLGGGSLVSSSEQGDVTVGPSSVGYRLEQKALAFEGDTLTSTDAAVRLRMIDGINSSQKLEAALSTKHAERIISKIRQMVERAVDQVKVSSAAVDVVLVGGGSVLLDGTAPLSGSARTVNVRHSAVANAVGAALSQVSGHVDVVAAVDPTDVAARAALVDRVKADAFAAARRNGADPASIRLVEIADVPLTYLPGNAVRLSARAVGDLNVDVDPNSAACIVGASTGVSTPLQLMATDELASNGSLTAKEYLGKESDCPVQSTEQPSPTVQEPRGPSSPNGPWVVTEADIECIAIGTGVLGCGGGGNPHIGKLRILQQLRGGRSPVVVSLDWLKANTADKNSMVAPVGFIGAPVALYERPYSGDECSVALALLNELLTDDMYAAEIKRKCAQSPHGVAYADHLPERRSGLSRLCAVMPFEIGGVNSTEPLAVSAALGLPCLDADLMGRAFPEFQMLTSSIYGYDVCPAVQVNSLGRISLAMSCGSAKQCENYMREVCIENGCSAGCVPYPLTMEAVERLAVKGSMSRSWRLGAAILRARSAKSSPIDAIVKQESGRVACIGKITDVNRRLEGGFSKGYACIESAGVGDFKVDFQNENLVLWSVDASGRQTAMATVPDLICVLNSEDGHPIATEELRYGMRVTVVVLAPDPLLTTPRALQVVGPKAFGYVALQ